jgi:putative membrane protein
MKVTALITAGLLVMSFSTSAQKTTNNKNEKIGKLSVTAFNTINKNGNRMVSAIQPNSTALSADDQQLFLQVANGGLRQLAISQAVLDKVTNPQVKILAASEVEEQTNVSAKLQQIATAKGVTLPSSPDAEAQALVAQVQNLSGAAVDAFYLTEGGIRGHELLQKTMQTVSKNAKDQSLKKLAVATLPVIRTHLSVSRDVKATTGSGATAAK